MNAGSKRHVPEAILEKYAMGMLGEREAGRAEEHLLVCAACQEALEGVDEYVRVMKAATARLERTTPLSFPEQRSAARRRQRSCKRSCVAGIAVVIFLGIIVWSYLEEAARSAVSM